MRTGGRLGAAALALAFTLWPAGTAHAATPDTDVTSCNGVLSGQGGGPLAKAFVAELNNNDGTFTLTYELTSPRPDGTSRVRDCAWVDQIANGQHDQGEPLFGTDDKDAVFAGGKTTISITVQALAGDTVCDRAARSDDTPSPGYTDKSNVPCHRLGDPPPVIPEAPLAILLPMSAAALIGVAFLVSRSRRTTPANAG